MQDNTTANRRTFERNPIPTPLANGHVNELIKNNEPREGPLQVVH